VKGSGERKPKECLGRNQVGLRRVELAALVHEPRIGTESTGSRRAAGITAGCICPSLDHRGASSLSTPFGAAAKARQGGKATVYATATGEDGPAKPVDAGTPCR